VKKQLHDLKGCSCSDGSQFYWLVQARELMARADPCC